MNIKKLVYRIKPPCPRCPYTLGQVHTLVNPCLACKATGYQTFERFQQLRRAKKLRRWYMGKRRVLFRVFVS